MVFVAMAVAVEIVVVTGSSPYEVVELLDLYHCTDQW